MAEVALGAALGGGHRPIRLVLNAVVVAARVLGAATRRWECSTYCLVESLSDPYRNTCPCTASPTRDGSYRRDPKRHTT